MRKRYRVWRRAISSNVFVLHYTWPVTRLVSGGTRQEWGHGILLVEKRPLL